MDTNDSRYAGLDRRLGAYAIDVLMLYAVLGGLQYALFLLLGGFPFNRLTTGPRLEFWVLLTISLPTWLYFTLSESSNRQATLGKRLFRLRVTDLHQERISRLRAFFRTLLKLLPWELTHLSLLLPTPIMTDPNPQPRLGLILVYLLLGLYMLSMIFTPRKRSLHDLLVGTLVLQDEKKDGQLDED
jgi:uncharacterized RDD family membrane protein YckC